MNKTKHAFVKIIDGELHKHLKNVTCWGKVEDENGWGTPGEFYLFGCINEDQQLFYEGLLNWDKESDYIGLQTIKEAEEFWLSGHCGMLLAIKEGDYQVIEWD